MFKALSIKRVSEAFSKLRSEPVHASFAGYLCLQYTLAKQGSISNLKPKWIHFFDKFYRVENHPIGTPYLKPFTEERPSVQNLWLNKNVAGSYALSSIRPTKAFSHVIDLAAKPLYSLKPEHAKLAKKYLLSGNTISAVELALFLYRDYVFPEGQATIGGLLDLFINDFGYSAISAHSDFETLFHVTLEDSQDSLFCEIPFELVEGVTSEGARFHRRIKKLSAEDVLGDERGDTAADLAPIKEIRIRGLLSFVSEVRFEFGALNILVGPNGSGKSNLIDCLRIFREAPLNLQQAFRDGGFEAWLNNGLDKRKGNAEVEVLAKISGSGALIRHQLRLATAGNQLASVEEVIAEAETEDGHQFFVGSYRSGASLAVKRGSREKERVFKEYDGFLSILSQIRDVSHYPEITRLGRFYSNIKIYSEWTFGRGSKLREAARTERTDTQLAENMGDLPVILNALEHTEAHEKILRLLPELKASYRDYVTRVMFGRIGLELTEVPFKEPVPASRLSDGTLRFLALASILLQPNPPPLICLEEPELGMHPDMIRMVANMIIDASSKTQIILSTHSEHLLSSLEGAFNYLYAFNSGENGSVVRKLVSNDFKEWRASHSLGDLWSSGELGGVRY